MTDINLSGLIERLRAATEGSRELDLTIHCLMFPDDDITKIATGHWTDQREWGVTNGSVWNRTEFGSASIPMPRYTTDLSAIVALVEKRLPGWGWSLQSYHNGIRRAVLTRPGEWLACADADAASVELATCIALLLALQTRSKP